MTGNQERVFALAKDFASRISEQYKGTSAGSYGNYRIDAGQQVPTGNLVELLRAEADKHQFIIDIFEDLSDEWVAGTLSEGEKLVATFTVSNGAHNSPGPVLVTCTHHYD